MKRNMKQVISCIISALILVSTVPLTGCQPSASLRVSWQNISGGQSVFGIVKLTVIADGGQVSNLKFYFDAVNEKQLLDTADNTIGATYTCDWYTQDIENGEHTLYAVADFGKAGMVQTSIVVKVQNLTRADVIPANIIKMTPANDPAPPQLADAFRAYWYDPVPLAGPINTAGAEDSPFINPDGNTLYFWFNGDETKDVTEQAKDPMTGIYWSKKVKDGTWQEPQRLFLQYFDKVGFDGAETVRGNTLWFASVRENNFNSIDMWTAELINERWTHWTNAGELLNKVYRIGELHVTADGNEIYFDSRRDGGKGEKDIWVTRKVDGQWQTPENIDIVNTTGNEGWPFISEDGNELWFTRTTPGPCIFRSLKVNGKWQTPEMIVSNLAGECALDAVGNLYFVHPRWDDSLNRVTESDIYVCYKR
jgi:hypothetical protein